MTDSEEDYMKMTFPTTTPTTAPETSLQRRLRLRREAEARSRPKSKSELAAEETARREAALSTSLLNKPTSTKSKGLSMMAKMGFTGGALGAKKQEDGKDERVTEPIRVEIRDGREGIGADSERKRKMKEAVEVAGEAVKKARVDEEAYRERVRREREEGRLSRQVDAAQKVAERMDEEGATGGGRGAEARSLRAVPVVYRGLVKGREEAERERRMRRDLEEATMSRSRLPVYEDVEEDEDDRKALGKDAVETTKYVVADDLEDEDGELEKFNSLPLEERLAKVVKYLRDEHRYCFWCKYAYPDAEMDGCPGLTEEDHD
ncbi:coiled-coil domain-containing 75 [Podospora aff. communis PSN243]|uniref:Coiled-coil domain-containing 75 n=1 Tax=Podospora aff. communis PSN243 TaxID=3040156 RepID=A0AAV9GP64_9PEZI|nr:coiled-coil domain-containing 75 [Podospora aff. communis PSN243]